MTGDNSQGQCGWPKEVTHTIGWRLLPGKFVDVGCCWESTVVITAKGEVQSCGKGLKGELGLGPLVQRSELSTVMQLNTTNGSVHCCLHNVCVQDGAELYGWGANTKCQLLAPKSRYLNTPTLIHKGTSITQVSLGKNFLCFVDQEELTIQGTASDFLPAIVQEFEAHKPCVQFHAMWSSLHMLAPGHLASFGQGNHGQLFKDAVPSAITSWATGSEHGVLCVSRQDVLCWGWGEHGNCGRLTHDVAATAQLPDENDYSNQVSPLNLVYTCGSDPTAAVYKCYGGCATTWICIQHN